MRRIKYIKSDKFFAKEYKDGIIVAFKNVGDNNSSYADQIHQMVSKNFGVDLSASDIIESISVTNSYKDSIKDSLFLYVRNGVSISACRISLRLNRDCIEVEYDSEKVLTVQKKRFKWLWCVCILVLLSICGYNTIFNGDIKPDEPSVEVQGKISNVSYAPVETDTTNNSLRKNEPVLVEEPIETSEEVVEIVIAQDEEEKQEVNITPVVTHDVLKDSVDTKTQREREKAERERQRRALRSEAKEYLRIADQAYGEYADRFDERIGIVALTNYQKALELNRKHGLISKSQRVRIEKRVKMLEEKLWL